MQTNFKRYEMKYILSKEQYKALLSCMPSDMKRDEYGRHKISNIYFDTEDYKIIRHSLEKPKYKEKLRVRCYGEPSEDSVVFIEIKKKFNGVVYKRRVYDNKNNVMDYLCKNMQTIQSCQILNEIDYFKNSYDEIKPKAYIAYEREAYFSLNDNEFRLTFDFNIKARNRSITFYESEEDKEVLSSDYIVLEVKTVMGLPEWFLRFLDANKIYKASFSKYGIAYQTYFLQNFVNELERK